jgi:hypothetical protein
MGDYEKKRGEGGEGVDTSKRDFLTKASSERRHIHLYKYQ